MSANSIFSNLTAENTAAEISLILSADYKRKKTVILLEGEDDVKVFRFLVGEDVTLIKAYGASTTVAPCARHGGRPFMGIGGSRAPHALSSSGAFRFPVEWPISVYDKFRKKAIERRGIFPAYL